MVEVDFTVVGGAVVVAAIVVGVAVATGAESLLPQLATTKTTRNSPIVLSERLFISPTYGCRRALKESERVVSADPLFRRLQVGRLVRWSPGIRRRCLRDLPSASSCFVVMNLKTNQSSKSSVSFTIYEKVGP